MSRILAHLAAIVLIQNPVPFQQLLGSEVERGVLDESFLKGVQSVTASAQRWMETPFRFVRQQSCALSCHTTLPFALLASRIRDLGQETYNLPRTALRAFIIAENTLEELEKRVQNRVAIHEYATAADESVYHWNPAIIRKSWHTERLLNSIVLMAAKSDNHQKAVAQTFELLNQQGSWDWMDEMKLKPFEDQDASLWGHALFLAFYGELYGTDGSHIWQTRASEQFERLKHASSTTSLHNRLVLSWVSLSIGGEATDASPVVTELIKTQDPATGSWSAAALGFAESSRPSSYSTALALLTLVKLGWKNSPEALRALEWLKSQQRASGRWEEDSFNRPGESFNDRIIGDLATAFALWAILETSL